MFASILPAQLGSLRSRIAWKRVSSAAIAMLLFTVLASCGGGSGGNSGGGGGGGTGGGGGSTPIPFTMTAGGQVTLQQGGAPSSFAVNDGGSDDSLPITVTISGVPQGLTLYGGSTYTFGGKASGTSYTWGLAATGSAPAASTISISATNGSTTQTWSVPVTVTAAAGFQVSLSQSSVTLTPGSSATIQATVTGGSSNSTPNVYVLSYPADVPFDEASIKSTGTNTFNITLYAPVDLSPLSSLPLFVGAYYNSDTSVAVAPLTLSISQPFPAITALTRSNAVRAGDAPQGAVYDQARKLVFAAYGRLNQVVVYDSLDQHLVATIPVPQYQLVNQTGGVIDESADGTKVYVAGPEKITVIDPSLLQVVGTQTIPFQPSAPAPGYPVDGGTLQLVTLADGKVLILNYDNHMYLWNPATGSIVQDDPTPPVFNSYALVRSADHSTALVYNSSYVSGTATVFSSGSDAWGASMPTTNNHFALSPDGSQIAATCTTSGGDVPANIIFYNNSFQQIGETPQTSDSCGVDVTSSYSIYSLDGKTLYAFMGQGAYGAAYNTQTFAPLGLFAAGDAVTVSEPYAVDESGLVYGSGPPPSVSGLMVTDASHPGAMGPDPNFGDGAGTFGYAYPLLNYPMPMGLGLASLSQTNADKLDGGGFDTASSYGVYFGPPPGDTGSIAATGVSVGSIQELDFTAPASTTPGPVNVTLTRSDGWNEVVPDGYTYEPYLLGVDPNAVPASGSTPVNIYGYGMQNAMPAVGSSPTTTMPVPNLVSNFDMYYPVQELNVTTGSGNPGWADLTITSASGTSTLHHAMQYVKSSQLYPLSGGPNAVVYDQAHQVVYVSNTTANNVAVFSLSTSAFLSPITVGNGPTSMVLTPDGSTLAVLNSTDETVSVINTTQLAVTGTFAAITAAEKSSTATAATAQGLAAMGAHQAIVTLTDSNYVHVLDLTSGSLSCSGVAGCDASGVDLQLGFDAMQAASTPNGTEVFLSDGQGHLALLNVPQNKLTAGYGLWAGQSLVAANADGNVFAQGLAVFDGNLNPLSVEGGEEFYYTDGLVNQINPGVFQAALNGSGSLLFAAQEQVMIEGEEVWVYDVRHGSVAMRLALPGTNDNLNGMALDETGSELFFSTLSGLGVVQLYEAPLSIASVTAGTGSAVTIRGSGFESGSTVQFGTTAASATYVDPMTLQAVLPSLPAGPIQVTVTNPDGSTYALDDGFIVK